MAIDRTLLRRILADPDQRRELMIRTGIAIQAVAGITTSHEQMAVAYDKVKQEKPNDGENVH